MISLWQIRNTLEIYNNCKYFFNMMQQLYLLTVYSNNVAYLKIINTICLIMVMIS